MDAFEYAIKKDIRNNAIVREIDHDRHRELWRWTAMAALVFGLLFLNALQHFEVLRHGYATAQLVGRRQSLASVQKSLKLRFDELRAPDEIAKLAVERGMVPGRNVVVLERVVTSEPPASSVVASR
jgi:hypothetical protein